MDKLITTTLQGKSYDDKVAIKSQEIANLGIAGEIPRKDVTITIESIETIDGGVEVFASASNGSGPIGFGDGTIETERFRIINPPILVPDPDGDIEITSVIPSKDGDTSKNIAIVNTYREDPQEALLQVLEQTISDVGKAGDAIVRGKVGMTTTTVFGARDLAMTKGNNYPAGGAYSVLHDASSASGTDTSNPTVGVQIRGGNVSNQFDNLVRYGVVFDTSSISDTDTITGATFGVVGGNGLTKEETITGQTIALVGFTPANQSSLAAGDYSNLGTTKYADTNISVTSYDTGGTNYNTWTLNATGIAAISVTGNTCLGSRFQSDIDNSAPTWASNNGGAYVGYNTVASSGTTHDPKMVITSTPAAATSGNFLTLLGV